MTMQTDLFGRPPVCAVSRCDTIATVRCDVCRKPVCSRCSTVYDQRRICQVCEVPF